MVLGQRRRKEAGPVTQGLKRELLTDDLLLDEEPRLPADLVLEDLLRISFRLFFRAKVVSPDADALPSREPDGLDHELEVALAQPVAEIREPMKRPVVDEPGDLVLAHEVARELLARLEARGLAVGPHRRDARDIERVDDPRREGRFRTDHRDVDPARFRPGDDGRHIGDVVDQDLPCGAADSRILVPHDRVEVGPALRKTLCNRVLAPAPTDEKSLHRPSDATPR